MKPSLCKLALVMSAAGLGLSLAEPASAAAALSTAWPAVPAPQTEWGNDDADLLARAREEFARASLLPIGTPERVAVPAGTSASSEDEPGLALAMVEIGDPADLWLLETREGLPPAEPEKPSLAAIELRAPRPRAPMPEALEWTRSPEPGHDADQLPEQSQADQADSAPLDEPVIAWLPSADTGDVADTADTAAVEATPGSCFAQPAVAAAESLITVASNEDRVLRSLAALLAGDDPLQGRFGAQTLEPIVSSHAEKALLHLAEIQRRPAHRQERVRTVAAPVVVARAEATTLESTEPLPVPASAMPPTGASTAPVGFESPSLPALAAVDLDPTETFNAPRIDIVLDVPAVRPRPLAALAVDIDLQAMTSPWAPLDIDLGVGSPASTSAAVDIDLPLGSDHDALALAPPAGSPFGPQDLHAVSSQALDQVRGGFSAAGGLQVSFGIERAVYVNGALVTTTSLNVSGLGTASPTSANPMGGTVALIQNGAGNSFVSGPLNAATAATVVQNTLNDQRIQSVTQINATVNSLQVVRSLNLGASMRSAVIDSLRR